MGCNGVEWGAVGLSGAGEGLGMHWGLFNAQEVVISNIDSDQRGGAAVG